MFSADFVLDVLDHVPDAINRSLPAMCAELLLKPGGSLLFQKSRGRNAANLQMDLINPLFFPRQKLQTFPHPW